MRLSAHNALSEGREYHLAEDELSAAAVGGEERECGEAGVAIALDLVQV